MGLKRKRTGPMAPSRSETTESTTPEVEAPSFIAESSGEALEADSDLIEELSAITHVEQTSKKRNPLEAPHAEPPEAPPELSDAEREYWNRRLRQISSEISATTSTRRAAVLLHDLGRIYEFQLMLPDRALEAYTESYHRFPGFSVNARALVRHLLGKPDYPFCLQVLEVELTTATTADERCAILIEMAEIRSRHLEDTPGALHDLARALKIQPDDPALFEFLVEIYQQTGDLGELEALLRRRARSVEDQALRSAMTYQIAALREHSLRDIEGAASLYRNALNTHPANTLALQAILRAARINEDYPAVAKLCESLAEIESGPAAAAALWHAARIYRDNLRNPELAISALERAAEISAQDRAILVELANIYEKEKRWSELCSALERAASVEGDQLESAAMAYRLGQVRLARLHDQDGAITALCQAITLSPAHIPARRMLGRIYTRRERWDELIGLLSDEQALFTDLERKATSAFKIGEIFETKLDNPDSAIEAYSKALELIPGFRPAIRGVSRIHSTLGNFQKLVEICERQIAHVADREEKVQLLRRLAFLWERKLKDPAEAATVHEQVLQQDPANHFSIRALQRLYPLLERWEDLVQILKADADQSMDRWRRVNLLTYAAEVQERQLQHEKDALQTYLDVLDVAPTHQPALMAVGRILQQAGRHEELLQLHQRELHHSDDPAHKIWLLMKIGRIFEDKMDRLEEAGAAYRDAMNLSVSKTPGEDGRGDPRMAAAADQLLRIYGQQENYIELIQLMQRLPLPGSPEAQSLYHRRIAEVVQRSQRPPLAIEHLRRANAASDDDASVHQLAWIYGAVEDQQNLINLYKTQLERLKDPLARVVVLHKLSRTLELADRDIDRVVEALEHLLELDPRNRIAQHMLELKLGHLAQWEKLAALLELSQAQTDDIDYRLANTLEISFLKEDRLGDLQGAAHSSYEVLERRATHPEALDTLERHYRASGNAEGLVSVIERQANIGQSTSERASLLAASASVYFRIGDIAKAEEIFGIAAEMMPSHLPAIRGWLRASRQRGDHTQSALALEALAAACMVPRHKSLHFYEAGQTWQLRQDDQNRAIDAYHKVLSLEPRHAQAHGALVAIHTTRQDWPALIELLGRAADLQQEPLEAKGILIRIADLQRSRLGDMPAARKTITRALAIDGDDVSLLTTLAELCRGESDWKALTRVDQRLTRLTADPVMLKALHFELGRIWEEKLGNVPKAIAEYRKVLKLDINDLGALTHLSELLQREMNWPAAAKTTERLIQRDDNRMRVKGYYLRLAQIYSVGFKNSRAAIEACRNALSLDPGDLEATEAMAKLLRDIHDLRGLQAHLASALAVHRARLERDPFNVPSYHALQKIFRWQGVSDAPHVLRHILAAIHAASPKDSSLLRKLMKHAPVEPSRAITPEEVEAVLLHPEQRGALFRLLFNAEPLLRKAFPHEESSLSKSERITARSFPQLAARISRIAKAMGAPPVVAYMVDGGLDSLKIADTSTPSLHIGYDMLEELNDNEFTFMVSKKIAQSRLRHPLFAGLGIDRFGQVVAALITTTCSSYISPFTGEDQEELQRQINKCLNKKNRRLLEPHGLDLSDRNLDPARWRLAMEQSENRIALALCGDIRSALRCILRTETFNLQTNMDSPEGISQNAGPRLRELLNFAISEEFLTLRERIGMAITTH